MKYPKLAAALGWAAEPDTAAEGIFLQPEEATQIENSLATGEALVTAEGTIVELNGTIETLTNEATTAALLASDNAITIAELQEHVKTLGGKSSGAAGSAITTAEDEVVKPVNTSAFPKFDSPDHPANQAAARIGKGIK